jgi:catechol 2,3-dioxygenase-like lactoylglutathione lyase family enzyme
MIDHTGFNVSDLELSKAFYLKALASLGYGISLEFEGAAGFGTQEGAGDDPGGDFWISAGEPQTPRTHVAFHAANEEQVNEFYRAAIEAGGKDNGPPGPRPHYHEGYYAAFVLDPDGYNIEAVFHGGGANAES